MDQYNKYKQQQRKYRKKFKRFNHQHRAFIYSKLFRIPLNAAHFAQINKIPLLKVLLPKEFPIKNKNIYNSWGIIVSMIAQYLSAPIGWLPSILHAFIVIMDKKTLMEMFEVCLSVIGTWYQHIHQNYPRVSNSWSIVMQQIIMHEFPQTKAMLQQLNTTFSKQMWPSIVCTLSDTTQSEQWQQIWDYLICNFQRPGLIISISSIWGHHIMKGYNANKQVSLYTWMCKKRSININEILQLSEQVYSKYKVEQRIKFANYIPLTIGQYPIINILPSLSLMDYLSDMKMQKTKRDQEAFKKLKCYQLSNDIQRLQGFFQNKIRNLEKDNLKIVQEKRLNYQGIVDQNVNKIQMSYQNRIKNLKELQQKFRKDLQNGQKTTNLQKKIMHQQLQWRRRMQHMQNLTQGQSDKILQIQKNTLNNLKQIVNLKIKEQQRKKEQLC